MHCTVELSDTYVTPASQDPVYAPQAAKMASKCKKDETSTSPSRKNVTTNVVIVTWSKDST